MPLMTLKAVADELGYKSVQSVYNLAAKGELTISHLPNAGGSKRAKGPPRVDSRFVDALKQRTAEGGARQDDSDAPPGSAGARVAAAVGRPGPAPKVKRPRRKPLGTLIHFE